jgi:hypothetical protein
MPNATRRAINLRDIRLPTVEVQIVDGVEHANAESKDRQDQRNSDTGGFPLLPPLSPNESPKYMFAFRSKVLAIPHSVFILLWQRELYNGQLLLTKRLCGIEPHPAAFYAELLLSHLLSFRMRLCSRQILFDAETLSHLK